MVVGLHTFFTEEERVILMEYRDIDVKLYIEADKLVYRGIKDGEECADVIKNPRRMIGVGGLYLLEIDDEPNEWHMGQLESDFTYGFWGNYGDLGTALKSL